MQENRRYIDVKYTRLLVMCKLLYAVDI